MMHKKSKILFVHKDFPVGGGVERVTINLARQFIKDGREVSFFITSELGEAEENCLKEFNVVTVSGGLAGKVFRLFDHIRQGNFGVVISAKEQANILVWLCSLLSWKFIPVYTRHCALDVSDQKLPAKMVAALYQLYALSRGKVVAVSHALAANIQKSLLFRKHQVTYCPNPVVDSRILGKAEQNLESFFHDGNYICSVGRLCEQKGFDRLLDAYAKVVGLDETYPDLIIVGEGPSREELISQTNNLNIAHKVRFAGFNKNPYYIMKNAKAFILSSRHEGLPTVLIEALALGVPVIAFDCPTGPKEILKNGKLGALINDGDIDAFVNAMQAVVSNPIITPSNAVKEYSFSHAAESYYKVFSND